MQFRYHWKASTHIAITNDFVSVLINICDVQTSGRAESFRLAQKNKLEKNVNL